MNHMIRLYLRTSEGALVRTLGLTERRGFQLLSCHLLDSHDQRQRLDLTVSAEQRSVAVLRRQLERLHDVLEVSCFTLTETESPPLAAVASGS
ncbi:MAG: hypothetical protein Tsb002_26090 [Wenzhouxiangellaceae bacterium]